MFKNYLGLSSQYFPNSDKFITTPMDQQLYVMGLCGDGQFGRVRGDEGDICAKRPTSWCIKTDNREPDPIVQFCCGERHSTVLTISGKVYSCGANSEGQLGRTTTDIIGLVEFRKKLKIVQISAGQNHNLAITDDGRLFSWGSNDSLQCGFPNSQTFICLPERVKDISQVSQISCGSASSICLLENNKVIIFGWYIGQSITPIEIELLNSIPVRQVNAGGDHFAVVSMGGSLLCWGRNDQNQTSVVNKAEVRDPVTVLGLEHVIQVACGANHTVVLTRNGNVYTFGANNFGQLGNGYRSAPLNSPHQVKELTGVQSIAAGNSHTLALTPNRFYSFGLNNSGQLGVGTLIDKFSPYSSAIMNAKALFAGWDQSVVLCGEKNWSFSLRIPRFIVYQEFNKLLHEGETIEVVDQLMFIFSSLGCINGSFAFTKDPDCYLTNSGINMDECMKFFNAIAESPHADRFAETIISSLEQTRFEEIYKLEHTRQHECFVKDKLRFFFVLFWFHPMASPSDTVSHSLLEPFVKLLSKYLSTHGFILRMWMRLLVTRHYNRIVQCLMSYLEFVFKKDHRNYDLLKPLLNILNELCQLNKETNKIPYNKFYLNSLGSKVNVRQEYINSVILKHPDKFAVPRGQRIEKSFWTDYPFLMNAEEKAAILEADSSLRMQLAVSASRAPWAQLLPIFNPEDTFLTYHVRRSHIVDDAYENVMRTTLNDVAKPLRVIFEGEEAEDRGGVRKEFFMLLFQALLQPTYGMFVEDKESRLIWFTGVIDDLTSYEVVGFLCALAIHNFVLINIPFPLALYKKILDQPITLEDFTELHPSEGHSLEKLLEYEGDDLEDVFCLDFSINIDALGHSTKVDLVPNGSNIPVTQSNKGLFVESYIQRKMELGPNGTIKDQMNAFIQGFKRVLNADVLKLFQPRELLEMIIGNENYDWQTFKDNTEYKGEYYSRHPVIKTFWDVFFELTNEQKRNFLLFLMGTDRVPLKGMNEIKMFIQPEPEELLPVAHTCFNLLDLPKLTSKEEMKRRLIIAIEHNTGFTLA